MFKRANKITSLLVAAAAVVSLAPTAALAADVKKIDSQDGTVYDAVAYKDGKALIDGEVEDNDGAYYYADGKYTELDDVNSGSDYAAYGAKYAKVDDGDYFVDLEAGTATDDSVDEDDQDDAASALRKAIKGTDRYADPTSSVAPFGDADIATLTEIEGNKFGDTWYSTRYAVDPGKKTSNAGGTVALGYYNVYTDAKGNYIDADYNLGKIKVSTTGAGATTSASVTIENTKDDYKLKNDHDTFAEITASSVLGQDKDSIYRYAVIKVTSQADSNNQIYINGKAFDRDGTTTYGGNSYVDLHVIQKISKAQASDDIDEAKYAKTVTNFVISNDKGAQATSGGTADLDNYLDLANGVTSAGIYNSKVEARVIGGKLVLFVVDNNASNTGDNVLVQAATLKSKNGYYYTDVEEKANTTAEYSSDLDRVAVDTDVDGNIFILDGGYIKKFDGTDDWSKVYKVDGSFDGLSVYDEDNMVAWSQGDEVYSLIGGTTTTGGDTTTAPAVTGWAQGTDGTWSFVNADGTKATGWLNNGGAWYYLNATGVMATGWVNDAGTWYYLNASGAMATGWLNDNGTWYYLNASGAMLANTTVDGYVLGASGAWVK